MMEMEMERVEGDEEEAEVYLSPDNPHLVEAECLRHIKSQVSLHEQTFYMRL